jgi:ABC-type nitrate/sulfonate/bicarbonate transport system substrate-binding protein
MVKKIPPTIKLAQWGQKHLLYLPLYVAVYGDTLKQHNINVELIYSGNDDDVFTAVANGTADFGVGDPIFTALHENIDKNITCVGIFVQRMAAWGITNQLFKH